MNKEHFTLQDLAVALACLTDMVCERLDSIELRLETLELRIDNFSEDSDRLVEYTLSGLESLNERLDYIDGQSERLESLLASIY